MKSVPNLISYFHEFVWIFFQFLAIYFERFSSRVILIRKTLTSGSHLSDAAIRTGPTWQHTVATWLPHVAPPRALNALSGPRSGVLTAPPRSDWPHYDRLSDPPRLTSLRPDRAAATVRRHAAVRVRSSSLSGRLRRREIRPR
jgi:hypothetical protein